MAKVKKGIDGRKFSIEGSFVVKAREKTKNIHGLQFDQGMGSCRFQLIEVAYVRLNG